MAERQVDAANVAEACKVSASTISRILNRKVISVEDETVEKLTRWIGKPIDNAVREPSAGYGTFSNGALAESILKLSGWIRTHPDSWPFILNAAKGRGYKDE